MKKVKQISKLKKNLRAIKDDMSTNPLPEDMKKNENFIKKYEAWKRKICEYMFNHENDFRYVKGVSDRIN